MAKYNSPTKFPTMSSNCVEVVRRDLQLTSDQGKKKKKNSKQGDRDKKKKKKKKTETPSVFGSSAGSASMGRFKGGMLRLSSKEIEKINGP